MNFDEASSKLESILDELEDGATNKLKPEEVEVKIKEAEKLRNYCKELLKKEKADIIRTAKENDISLEDIGLSEDDDDDWDDDK
ncbi:MAG: hypothetical protein LBB13_01375 [Rickettsiales bacterium]|nr:hypothetical protein [Rickettsiales bacterium]